jgi:hypothetical protein
MNVTSRQAWIAVALISVFLVVTLVFLYLWCVPSGKTGDSRALRLDPELTTPVSLPTASGLKDFSG